MLKDNYGGTYTGVTYSQNFSSFILCSYVKGVTAKSIFFKASQKKKVEGDQCFFFQIIRIGIIPSLIPLIKCISTS